MARVTKGKAVPTKKKKTLKATEGFLWGRKSKFKLAKDAYRHAQVHAYKDRRRKKGDFRRLWQIRINAAARQNGLTYSQLVNRLNKAEIRINRKMLALVAQKEPAAFAKLIEKLK